MNTEIKKTKFAKRLSFFLKEIYNENGFIDVQPVSLASFKTSVMPTALQPALITSQPFFDCRNFLTGKMVLCVVGHMPWEINRYTLFGIEGGANITGQVVSTNTKRSPLTQGGLKTEIKVTVISENKKNLKIFAEKVNLVQFTLGEPHQDDTKKILHEIKRKENDVCVSVSSDEEPED